MIADAGLAQGHFQRTRLLVGAEQDGLVAPGDLARQPRKLDFLGGGFGLGFVVGKSAQDDFGTLALLRP